MPDRKKIIIMGATSGLGLRLAEAYASLGWRVGVAGRKEAPMKALKQMFPSQIEWMRIDVTKQDAPDKLMALIAKVGGMDEMCIRDSRSGDFGGEAIKYPMFWVKMSSLRPYLIQQSIFIDDDNNLAQYNYDDFFQLALYEGDIYKTRNLRNRSMMQLYPDPDEMKKAQDSIQNYLVNYEKKMWVPSREEIIAQREERERLASGDTIALSLIHIFHQR